MPPSTFDIKLAQRIEERRSQGKLRTLQTQSDLIDFASNDYLGLARSKELQEAIRRSPTTWPKMWPRTWPRTWHGSTGSRLLTGHHPLFDEVEGEIASFHGSEASLLYTCGYMANLGLIQALASPADLLLYDAHLHASFWDGAKLTGARVKGCLHNDLDHREQLLQGHKIEKEGGASLFVCVESIYSLDGSMAPLKKIETLCDLYGAHLIIDEAHALGILGIEGRGIATATRAAARIYTFGKALGVHGAAIVGSHLLRQYLVQFSRPLWYTTAMPPSHGWAIRSAYQLMRRAEEARTHLQRLKKLFEEEAHRASLPLQGGVGATYALPIGCSTRARHSSLFLRREGIDVRAILPPTVGARGALLRICLHSFNEEEEISWLTQRLVAAVSSSPA